MNNIRIFHPTAKVWIKKGFKDHFATYTGFVLATIGIGIFMWDWRHGLTIARYKPSYTVFRPTDAEIYMYPKHYITDNHLLKPDHPEKLEDCDDMPKGKPIFEGRTYRQLSFICK